MVAHSAIAQTEYDLSSRNMEPARARVIPYHNMTTALAGNASQSRFVATVEEPSRNDNGTTATFTTHFALPVTWLNRQVLLRVGYASSAYTVTVNGREMGFATSGVMGAEFNITKASKEGLNEVVITLDKSLLANKLYEAKELKVENIEIFTQPTIRIRDIVAEVRLNELGEGIAEVAIPVKCDALNRKEARMHYALRLTHSAIRLSMRLSKSIRICVGLFALQSICVGTTHAKRMVSSRRISSAISR